MSGSKDAKSERSPVAFVLLAQARLPNGQDIARSFASFAPKKQTIRIQKSAAEPSDILTFEFSTGGTAFVMLASAAIPNGEAEDWVPCSVSAMGTGWKLPPHTAHLVVVLREASGSKAIDSLSTLTSLLAAVAEASGAVGIYWGSVGATHDPAFFISVARELEPAARIVLWTGIRISQDTDGRAQLLSLGMRQLELPDLLLTAPNKSTGAATLEPFFDLLCYVVDRGEPLPEGDTVGRDAKERLTVRYVPSPVDPDRKVWRVDLE